MKYLSTYRKSNLHEGLYFTIVSSMYRYSSWKCILITKDILKEMGTLPSGEITNVRIKLDTKSPWEVIPSNYILVSSTALTSKDIDDLQRFYKLGLLMIPPTVSSPVDSFPDGSYIQTRTHGINCTLQFFPKDRLNATYSLVIHSNVSDNCQLLSICSAYTLLTMPDDVVKKFLWSLKRLRNIALIDIRQEHLEDLVSKLKAACGLSSKQSLPCKLSYNYTSTNDSKMHLMLLSLKDLVINPEK